MSSSIQRFYDKLSSNPKHMFLIDSLGALLTAVSLSVILAPYERFFGMPKTVLYVLSSVACVFAIYSALCYFFVGKRWRIYLTIIAWANFVYSGATIALVIYHYQRLTLLGLVYFFLEWLVICSLVLLERTCINRTQ